MQLELLPVEQRIMEGPAIFAPEDPCRFLGSYFQFLEGKTPHVAQTMRNVLSRRYPACAGGLSDQAPPPKARDPILHIAFKYLKRLMGCVPRPCLNFGCAPLHTILLMIQGIQKGQEHLFRGVMSSAPCVTYVPMLIVLASITLSHLDQRCRFSSSVMTRFVSRCTD